MSIICLSLPLGIYAQTSSVSDETQSNPNELKSSGLTISSDSMVVASATIFALLSFGAFLNVKMNPKRMEVQKLFWGVLGFTFFLQIIFLIPVIEILLNTFNGIDYAWKLIIAVIPSLGGIFILIASIVYLNTRYENEIGSDVSSFIHDLE